MVRAAIQITANENTPPNDMMHVCDTHAVIHMFTAIKSTAVIALHMYFPPPNVFNHAILSNIIVETLSSADISTSVSNVCVVERYIVITVFKTKFSFTF